MSYRGILQRQVLKFILHQNQLKEKYEKPRRHLNLVLLFFWYTLSNIFSNTRITKLKCFNFVVMEAYEIRLKEQQSFRSFTDVHELDISKATYLV